MLTERASRKVANAMPPYVQLDLDSHEYFIHDEAHGTRLTCAVDGSRSGLTFDLNKYIRFKSRPGVMPVVLAFRGPNGPEHDFVLADSPGRGLFCNRVVYHVRILLHFH